MAKFRTIKDDIKPENARVGGPEHIRTADDHGNTNAVRHGVRIWTVYKNSEGERER